MDERTAPCGGCRNDNRKLPRPQSVRARRLRAAGLAVDESRDSFVRLVYLDSPHERSRHDIAAELDRSAARDADEPYGLRDVFGDLAGSVESVADGMLVKHQFKGTVELRSYARDPGLELCVFFRRPFRAHAARNYRVAPEAVAAEQSRHIEIFAAYPPAERRRLEKGDVSRERAEIADVVCDALKLEKDVPQTHGLAVYRPVARGERAFHQFRERDRRGGRSVAGACLRERGLTRDVAAGFDHRLFDAAMLVAEKDLKIVDVLAHALEAEMPRLDNARVHGTDRDFMGRRAFEGNYGRGVAVSAERIDFFTGFVRRFKGKQFRHRLRPEFYLPRAFADLRIKRGRFVHIR